ncbi:MAG TPA: hypothetical protein VL463_05900 [Kofleriaceae bacterium]|nr:hypothetical protein [Kofleriaceae bacterium]
MPAKDPSVRPQTLPRFPSSPSKLAKIVIGSLDDPGKGVEAQYNPRELTIDKSVPWTPHKVTKANEHDLEFTGGDPRSMSLELTFDGFESGQSVEQAVLDLVELATVRDPNARDEDHLRPHLVAVVWGQRLERFRGVIESLSTKYTMFLPDGTPARATCTVKIKEANNPGVAKQR